MSSSDRGSDPTRARDLRDLELPQKLGLLAALYFSQGLPFGFFQQALPVMLRDRGFSLALISMSSLLQIPWALKFLWAPLIDNREGGKWGRRRQFILPLQGLMAIVLALLAISVDDFQLTIVLGAVFVINLLAATQDIATDGLAVDMLRPDERGLANGLQVAGYRVGMVIGGGAILILYQQLGWQNSFLLMATMIGLATLPLALTSTPEPPFTPKRASAENHAGQRYFAILSSFVRRKNAWKFLVLIVIFKFGDALALGMVRPLLVDRGLGLADIGWLLGTVGFAAGLVGAMAGGALVARIGRTESMLAFGAIQAATVIGYGWIATDPTAGKDVLYALTALEHLAGGMATSALFTRMMDWCRKETSATDYTVQASIYVIAHGVAGAASGFSAQQLGYAGHFFVSGGVALVALAFVRILDVEPPSE